MPESKNAPSDETSNKGDKTAFGVFKPSSKSSTSQTQILADLYLRLIVILVPFAMTTFVFAGILLLVLNIDSDTGAVHIKYMGGAVRTTLSGLLFLGAIGVVFWSLHVSSRD